MAESPNFLKLQSLSIDRVSGDARREVVVSLLLVAAVFSGMSRRLEAAGVIAFENSLPGNPPSEWDVQGIGDPSIQGFATDISVNRGDTISFKINTTATNYRIDIYRLGYYGGLGARKVATVTTSATLPQTQPPCVVESATMLVDCGNWAVSASWQVPASVTSGVYIARPVRGDTGGASHIVFIVRDDAGQSDILFQTADTTWQAYNNYGGINLYRYGTKAPFRAYKVSYNRPFNNRATPNFAEQESFLFDSEYPMIRWLEANGYEVSYMAGVDTERRGSGALTRHKVFLSVGHDEYWSHQQRANVEAAVAAGVHVGFFSGNEVYWKTRWENSIAGASTAYRTLVCYKETHANAKIDPSPAWTGTFRDPRFSPPADGGRPENALTGQLYTVDAFRNDSIRIPSTQGKLRFWRNTGIDTLADGETAVLPAGVLGFEWNEVVDNGLLPPGLFRLSRTTVAVPKRIQDYGSTFAPGTATHSLTLYRHSSGALVFGAGTIRWSWGLDSTHYLSGPAPDIRMQQATVNLLADMGVQPMSLQAGLVPATESTDNVPPTSVVLAPFTGGTVSAGTTITITGTATDTGGGKPAGVEYSVDGGAHWRLATGAQNWSATWTPLVPGSYTIRSRAVDDSGRIETPGPGTPFTVVGPPMAMVKLDFEDGTGTVATDGSGLGNHGSLRNGPVWTPGKVGGGLAFDGQNDMVVVANAPSIAALTTQLTVAAWVYRATTQTSWAAVLSRQLSRSPYAGDHWWLGFTNTGQYRWFVNTTAGYSSTTTGSAAPVGQWVHMVGTYDGAMVRLYVNGVQQFALAHTGALPTDTTGLLIGASVNDLAQTPVEALNGQVDQVRVFNVALTASEVQALYVGTPPPPDTTAPAVTNVTSSTANGNYRAGAAVTVQVSFSEAVTVTGTPQVTLETGANDGVAAYVNGSGTATLTFGYTVAAGHNAADLDYTSVGALTLNAGTIRDAAGNAARLTLPVPGTTGSLGANKALVVDTTAPTIPTGLSGTPGSRTATLSWTAATDNIGVTGYRIYRDGTAVGTSAGTSFQDTGLGARITYSYTVAAIDGAANESARSVAVDVTTLEGTSEILRLDFEDGTGTVATDGSGLGNHGSLRNGPVWTTGQVGGGLAFDGQNDMVVVANAPSITALTAQLTVAAWVFRAATQTSWTAAVSRQLGTSPYYGDHWWLGFSNTGRYRWFVNTTAGYSSTTTGSAAPVGQWVHMVGTYDGAMVRLYVNGVQQFALAHTGALPTDTTGLLIGASVNDLAQTPVEALNGRVDQVRVYNVALTASEVQALYVGTPPPPLTADVAGATAYQIDRGGIVAGTSADVSFPDAADIARLDFDAHGGTKAKDSSGQRNDGTLLNAVGWTVGKRGSALRLDGANDVAHIASSPSLDSARTEITVAAWVFRQSAQDGWATAVSRQVKESAHRVFWLGLDDNGEYRWFVNTAVAGYSSAASGGPAPIAQWVHLTGTYDGSTVRLYVNGVERYAIPHSGPLVEADGGPLTLGASYYDGGGSARDALRGRIDEFRMYSRALSSSEVQSLYAEGNLDATPPFSAITSPAAGATLSGVVTLRALVLDDQELAGVQFWVDGVRVSGEVTSTPYQVTFHTGAYSNGPHVLTAVARDTSGNTGRSAAVYSTFSNGTAWLGKTMAIGDSLTVGYVSASDPRNSDGGYRRHLWERLAVDSTLAIDFVGSSTSGALTMDRDHEGHGNRSIEQLTSMIPAWFASNPPDNVLLLTGTMDLLADTDPAVAVRRLGALLDRIHTTRPSARILVASLPGTTPGAHVPGDAHDISAALSAHRIEEYNSGIPWLVNARASKGWNITFVDLHDLAGLNYAAGSPDFGADGIHLSSRGYEKIASVWYTYLLTNLPPIASNPDQGAVLQGPR